jgi:hypothetical protein
MKINPKCRPRGKPFPKGACAHRNGGGRPFIKVHQRLSKITADMLTDQADVEIAAMVGLGPGASWGECVTKSMILQAAVNGNVGAAHFLHQCTEAAKVLVNVNFDATVYVRAKERLKQIIADLPALPEPPEQPI